MNVTVVAAECPFDARAEPSYISSRPKNLYKNIRKSGSIRSFRRDLNLRTSANHPWETKIDTWKSLLTDVEASINNLEKCMYVKQVQKVEHSIRQILLASDISCRYSELARHQALSDQLHKVLGEVKWLVVICKLADSIWPPDDVDTKIRSQSKILLKSMDYFVTLVQQYQITPHPISANDSANFINLQLTAHQGINYQGAVCNENEFIKQLDLFAECIISEVSKVAKSTNRLSLDGNFTSELVDEICQIVEVIGQLLCLTEEMNVPAADDNTFLNNSPRIFNLRHAFLEKKQNMYNDVNQLVTEARALLFDFSQESSNPPITAYIMRVLVSSEELVVSTKHLLEEKKFAQRIGQLGGSDTEKAEPELKMLKRRVASLRNLRNEDLDSDSEAEASGEHSAGLNKYRVNTRSSSYSSASSLWSNHKGEEPRLAKNGSQKYFQCSSVENLECYMEARRRTPCIESPKHTYLQSSVGGDNKFFRLGNFSAHTFHVCESATDTGQPGTSLICRRDKTPQQKPRKQSVFEFQKPPILPSQALTLPSKISFSLGLNSARRPSLPTALTSSLFFSHNTTKSYKRMGFFRKRSLFDISEKKGFSSGHEGARENDIHAKSNEWYLAYDYSEEEVVFNDEGQLIGGTIQVLVERLTLHDTSIDSDFVNVFLLTFRNFCLPMDFCQLLLARYHLSPPPRLTSAELQIWEERKLVPIRLRVYNILKTWLESYFYEDEDYECLKPMLDLARYKMKIIMPAPAERLIKLIEEKLEFTDAIEKLSNATGSLRLKNSKSVGRLMAAAAAQMSHEPPPPMLLPKSTLNMLCARQNINLMDIDPTEVARQLTIIENELFCSIRPHELIGQEFSKKEDSLSFNVRNMSKMSTRTTEWVVFSIIQEENIRRRSDLLRYFICLAKKCYSLNNFQSLMAIMCGLNLSIVSRLKRTWSLLSGKYLSLIENLRYVTDHSRNYHEYRKQIKQAQLPCLPFMGVYLTDLTFMNDGNPSFRRTDLLVINFSKHVKTVRIIEEIQRFQVPYNLTSVPSLRNYLTHQIETSSGWNPEELYAISLKREPRKEVMLVGQRSRASSS